MNDYFQVGEWVVQPRQNVISQNGTTVRLEPKIMSLLTALAEKPGEVESKDALLEKVWTDTFVTEQVLKVAVSELRKTRTGIFPAERRHNLGGILRQSERFGNI